MSDSGPDDQTQQSPPSTDTTSSDTSAGSADAGGEHSTGGPDTAAAQSASTEAAGVDPQTTPRDEDVGPAGNGADTADDDTGTPLAGGDPTDPEARNLLLGFREEEADLLAHDHIESEERYWLNRPFAYAVIVTDERTTEQVYHVIEPDLDEHEAKLYQVVRDRLSEMLPYLAPAGDDVDRAQELRAEAHNIVEGLAGFDVADPSFEKVLYFLRRDLLGSRYGRIDALMRDQQIEEISADAPGTPVYVYHRSYENLRTNIEYGGADELDRFVSQIAQRAGKNISTSNPTEGMSLPDGSRVQLSKGDISPDGPNYTIRKFADSPFTPVELIKLGTFSLDQIAYLWVLIETGFSGLVGGGTATGKTATLNALSMFVPPGEKVVSIEDTRELTLPQDNHVPLLTREGFNHDSQAELDMQDLLSAGLRMRPDYIVVGEVREEEARAMFQAMNTGHTTFSTVHADSLDSTFGRLTTEPMSVERRLIGELGFLAIQTTPDINDSESDGTRRPRRNQEIHEVKGIGSGNEIQHRKRYGWNEATDTYEEKAESHHFETLRRQGRNPEEMFEQRRRLLEYLLEHDVTDYEPVVTAVRAFIQKPELVLEQVENDNIDFDELEALQ